MMRLYIPVAVTVVLLAAATWQEAIYSDRFVTTNVALDEIGKRFANVPQEVGPWKGADKAVSDEVVSAAGAVHHMNRTYVNENTKEKVDVWLIVGHSREICRHTPNICYPSQGFSMIGDPLQQVIATTDGKEAVFHSAKFRSESLEGLHAERVFWAWNGNRGEQLSWEAPSYQKQRFGNNPALYKLYFTSRLSGDEAMVEGDLSKSTAVKFAQLMIPKIDEALFPERYAQAAPSQPTSPTL